MSLSVEEYAERIWLLLTHGIPFPNTDGDSVSLVDPSFMNAEWNTKGLRVLIGPTDVISNMPVFQLYDHHQIHEGETWRWSTWVLSLIHI